MPYFKCPHFIKFNSMLSSLPLRPSLDIYYHGIYCWSIYFLYISFDMPRNKWKNSITCQHSLRLVFHEQRTRFCLRSLIYLSSYSYGFVFKYKRAWDPQKNITMIVMGFIWPALLTMVGSCMCAWPIPRLPSNKQRETANLVQFIMFVPSIIMELFNTE